MKKLSEEIAYEIGVHVGDGSMYSNGKMCRITISGSLSDEKEYYRKVLQPLTKRIYGVEPRYYERPSDNTVLLITNSKDVVNFKQNILGLPAGKKDTIRIPEQIKSNHKLLRAFLRGLGDTDFSVSFKKNRKGKYVEPRLEMYTKSEFLVEDVRDSLTKLGFTLSVEKKEKGKYNGFMVRMYGKRNLQLWLDLIGFQNPSRIVKIKFWKKFGFFVPRKNYCYYVNKIK